MYSQGLHTTKMNMVGDNTALLLLRLSCWRGWCAHTRLAAICCSLWVQWGLEALGLGLSLALLSRLPEGGW